jgi:hypothetical protein
VWGNFFVSAALTFFPSFTFLIFFFLSILSPHCTCSTSLSYFTFTVVYMSYHHSQRISALLHNFVISVFPWSSSHYTDNWNRKSKCSECKPFSLLSFCCIRRHISYECVLSMLFKMLSQIITHLYIV